MIESIYLKNYNKKAINFQIRNKLFYSVLINLVMVSVFAKGLLFELIGACALFLLFICSFNIKIDKREMKATKGMHNLISVCALILCLFFIFQFLMNGFDLWGLIAWRGTTRSAFCLLLVWFCIRKYYSLGIGIHTILPLLIIMNAAQLIYIYTNIEWLNLFQASWNYLGAVDIAVFPFVFRFETKSSKISKIVFCSLFIFVVAAMGSRSVFVVAMLLFVGMMVLERNKKYKRIFIVSLLIIFALFVVLLLTENPHIMRALTVFGEGRHDSTREAIIEYAKTDFYNKSLIGQLFGDGKTNVSQLIDFPVHNFFWELMLAYGYIGCGLWIVFHGVILFTILFSKNTYKWYLCLFGLCSILMNYYQPFITNGFLYQFLFFFGGCQLFLSGQKTSHIERNKKHGK